MKKFIYIILLTFATGISLSACTKDEVKPIAPADNGGGNASGDPLKGR